VLFNNRYVIKGTGSFRGMENPFTRGGGARGSSVGKKKRKDKKKLTSRVIKYCRSCESCGLGVLRKKAESVAMVHPAPTQGALSGKRKLPTTQHGDQWDQERKNRKNKW